MKKMMFCAALGLVLLGSAAARADDGKTLKEAFKGDFVIGAAINADQITGRDSASDAILKKQFNAITPENDLKWERIHPTPAQYDFAVPDKYVALGVANHMYTVGHVLVWHNQTPDWVFKGADGRTIDRKMLLERLRAHIFTVVGRYKGMITAWDVVNEALNEDGTLRESKWMKIIGEDYIAKAFEYAHEADPQAELTYNDFSIENPAKRAGAVALIKKLKAAGVPVTTVGIQGHYNMTWPTVQQLDDTIAAFKEAGVKVAITELDIDVLPPAKKDNTAEVSLHFAADPALNPFASGLPPAEQQKLADRYASLFHVFMKYRGTVERVTLWGINDAQSWLNDWPVKGRSSYPLLFGRDGKPKQAFFAVQATAADAPQK